MVRISGGKYTASRTQGNRRIFSEGYLNKGNCSNHSSSLLDGDSKSRSDNMNQKQSLNIPALVLYILWVLNVSHKQGVCKPEDQLICIWESQNY